LYCDATCRSAARRKRSIAGSVNTGLTAIKRQASLDSVLSDAVTRVRTAEGIEAVAAARELSRLTEQAMREAVDRARDAGATWQEIGDVLGASRQAAFQRFGRPAGPPADPAAAEHAVAVMLELAEGRYADVRARFDAAMTKALSEQGLADTLERLGGLVGEYRGMGEPFAHRAGDLTVVRVPLRFEAGEMSGQVTFDRDWKIAGLYITPPAAI
jgi:hypothetical protein